MLLRLALLVALVSPLTDARDGVAEAENLAFAFLSGHGSQSRHAFLTSHRPSALDPEARRQISARLPPMDVEVSAPMRARVAAADRIFDIADRHGAIDVRFCQGRQAQTALYFRTSILVSVPTMNLLSDQEFAAAVAHELAHDYDWDTYWQAVTRRDNGRMMMLELRADALAVLMLEEAQISPERLVSAVTKMTRWNEQQNSGDGEAGGTMERYLPLKDRVEFIRRVAREKWL